MKSNFKKNINMDLTKKTIEKLRLLGENPKDYLTHYGNNFLLKDTLSGVWLKSTNNKISTGHGFNLNNNNWTDYMLKNNFSGSEINNLQKALRYAYKYQKKWMNQQKKDLIELKLNRILKNSNINKEQIKKLVKLYINN